MDIKEYLKFIQQEGVLDKFSKWKESRQAKKIAKVKAYEKRVKAANSKYNSFYKKAGDMIGKALTGEKITSLPTIKKK